MQDIETRAVDYVAGVLSTGQDWQKGQHALADHDELGAWIRRECEGDELAEVTMCQTIIGKAEEKLGDRLPY